MLYTQLINFKDDDYTVRVAHSEEKAYKLIGVGFEPVCDFNGNKLSKTEVASHYEVTGVHKK